MHCFSSLVPAPVLLVFLLTLVPDAGAQVPLARLAGKAAGDELGTSVAGVGTTGFVGAPYASAFLNPDVGVVFSLGYVQGQGQVQPLSPIAGNQADGRFGFRLVKAHDIDGNGAPDLMVGVPRADLGGTDNGEVVLLDTRTGAVTLNSVELRGGNDDQMGWGLSAPGDFDGDGTPDLVMGAPRWWTLCSSGVEGLFRVVSAGGGTRVWQATGGRCNNDQYGRAMAPTGEDVDNSGSQDFALGMPTRASVRVFGWVSGSPTQIWSAQGGTGFGRSLFFFTDLNGDNVAELVVGAPGANEAEILDGATGARLSTTPGGSGTDVLSWSGAFGESCAAVGDQDGDGVEDFAVGAPDAHNVGQVLVFSGKDRHTLALLSGTDPGGRFGASIAAVADSTGDGVPEILVGAPKADVPDPQNPGSLLADAGEAILFTLSDQAGTLTHFGAPCTPSGTSGLEPLIGLPKGEAVVGETLTVGLSQVPALTNAILVMGFNRFSPGIPLPIRGRCELYVDSPSSWSTATMSTIVVSGAGMGNGWVDVGVPPSPSLKGLPVYAQWYVVDPGPAILPGTMSRALQFYLQ